MSFSRLTNLATSASAPSSTGSRMNAGSGVRGVRVTVGPGGDATPRLARSDASAR